MIPSCQVKSEAAFVPVATGTPSGVGPLKAGDVVTVKVEGVGELRNPVAEE